MLEYFFYRNIKRCKLQIIISLNPLTNMKLFSHGGNYYSLNKSEMDLGPIHKFSFSYLDASEEIEPAPSPAPGTPSILTEVWKCKYE